MLKVQQVKGLNLILTEVSCLSLIPWTHKADGEDRSKVSSALHRCALVHTGNYLLTYLNE